LNAHRDDPFETLPSAKTQRFANSPSSSIFVYLSIIASTIYYFSSGVPPLAIQIDYRALQAPATRGTSLNLMEGVNAGYK